MVKLVGVLGGGEDGSLASPRVCLARRQLPLTIEQDLTMIMALDDYCMACGGMDPCGQDSQKVHDQDCGNFLRNYRRWVNTILTLYGTNLDLKNDIFLILKRYFLYSEDRS